TIGQRGSLDVTVAQLPMKQAFRLRLHIIISAARTKLILATMRHLLRELGRDLNVAIKQANTPHERIAAIIAVNFSATQFAQETIAAWLTFYVHAQQSDDIKRLLRIYARRLHSNLVFALEQLTSRARANRIAEGAGAMIDGLYIRHALGADAPDAASAIALVEDYIAIQLSGQPSAEN
nr:transcriptional regulator BetI [Brucella abortus]